MNFGETRSFLLVADDAAGGFFALNAGALGDDTGKIYYLSQENLKWEPLHLTYTEFLNFCFNGDLKDFYKDLRWTNWKTDVKNLNGNYTYNFFPFLWTKEGKDINKVSRKAVPIDEQFSLLIDLKKQLENK